MEPMSSSASMPPSSTPGNFVGIFSENGSLQKVLKHGIAVNFIWARVSHVS